MTPRDFCYWLQGYFEVANSPMLNDDQARIVKNHLALVFKHEIDTPDPTGELQAIHDGKKTGDVIGDTKHAPLYRC